MVNYYTSPELAETLASRDTGVVGTVRANRREMPEGIKEGKFKKGESKWMPRDRV